MCLKVIIFDFDGTIADTYDAIVEITNGLSSEFGYQPVEASELAQLKNMSSQEIIKQSKLSIFKIPFLLKRVKEDLAEKIGQLKPIPGIASSLLELQQGYRLGIITSNSQENVVSFLNNNGLSSLFDFIYSGTTLFGKHRVIQKALKQHQITADSVLYVGDETRDIIAAQRSKIKMAAVSWGFNSALVLSQYHPDFLIEQPSELLKVVDSLAQPSQQAL